jgi:uncharacterized membrane protein
MKCHIQVMFMITHWWLLLAHGAGKLNEVVVLASHSNWVWPNSNIATAIAIT